MHYRLLVPLLLVALMAPSPRVSIVRAPNHVWDDEPVVLMVQVEPDADNRLLVIAALDEGLVIRQSTEQLDGDKARRTRWVRWERLSAGELMITAIVITVDGKQGGRAQRPITVLARR